MARWFVISALAGLAFLVAFLFWPWQYEAPGDTGHVLYRSTRR